jgi:hypothetical protein
VQRPRPELEPIPPEWAVKRRIYIQELLGYLARGWSGLDCKEKQARLKAVLTEIHKSETPPDDAVDGDKL